MHLVFLKVLTLAARVDAVGFERLIISGVLDHDEGFIATLDLV